MEGKYFSSGSNYMYYVESEEEGVYTTWLTMNYFCDQSGMNTRHLFKKDEFYSKILSGEIIEIAPPTFYIITKRDTYSVKEEIKSAGGMWAQFSKFWYFNDKPNLRYSFKECLVFPFSGKKVR